MDKLLRDSMLATRALSEEDVNLLETGEQAGYGPIENWSMATFQEVLDGDPARAYVAQNVVGARKVGEAPAIGQKVELPEFPPYLDKGADGKPVGYDPHNPAQFWTDPATDEKWRWDGKGRGIQTGKSPITGEVIPPPAWPFGEPHRVDVVEHKTFDGVLIPDLQQMHDANANDHDWFHRGYNCWIGKGGKPYGKVDPELRRRVISAMNRSPQADQALVRRPPRVA